MIFFAAQRGEAPAPVNSDLPGSNPRAQGSAQCCEQGEDLAGNKRPLASQKTPLENADNLSLCFENFLISKRPAL